MSWQALQACPATCIMSAGTYQVITCIGTGTQRTTGVKASKLGFASIRSSPALQWVLVKSTVQQQTTAAQLASESH